MKKYIYLILFICSVAVAGTIQFGDLTVKGATISEGNLSTNAFLSATTGIASLNGGTLRLHETNVNGGSKVTVQTVSNLSADYALTLPPNDGDASQVLTTDGNGVLTWETPGAGSVTASSTTTFTNKTIDADGTGNSITNIENADIKAAAAIAVNKLAAVTASRVVTSDGSGFLTTGNVDTTELLLLDGVTGVLTTNAGTQTLTNKTLTSPAIGTTATFTDNASAQFFEATGGGSSKITVAAPAALAGDVTFTLPPDNGTSGYVLQTNGSGVTTWVVSSGGASVAGLYCTISWGYGANAFWEHNSTTFTTPAADTDYPAPTVTTSTLGTAAGVTCSAPGTKRPQLVTASLPAGEYQVVVNFPGSSDSTNRCYGRITDATTNGFHVAYGGGTSLYDNIDPVLNVVYGSTQSPTFSFQLASSAATACYVNNGYDTGIVNSVIYLYRIR